MGQEHEFFQNQGPKEDVSPEGRGREGDRNSISSCYVSVPVFTLGRSRGMPSALVRGGELSLVSGRWRLEGKMPSGYLHRAGPLMASGGFCHRGN